MNLWRAVPQMIGSTLILLLIVTAPVGFAQAGSRGGGGGGGGGGRAGGGGGGAVIGGGRGSGSVGGGVRGGVPGGGGRDYPSHGRTYGDHPRHDRGDRFFFGFSGAYAPAWWWYDPYYYWGASPYYYNPYYYGYPYFGTYYYGYPYYYGSDPCASQDPTYAPYCPPPTDYPYDPGYGVPPVTYPLPAPPGGESQPSTSPDQPTSPTSGQTP